MKNCYNIKIQQSLTFVIIFIDFLSKNARFELMLKSGNILFFYIFFLLLLFILCSIAAHKSVE